MLPNLIGKKLILASQSPRRKQLLADIGLSVTCVKLAVEEHFPPHLDGEQAALYLAALKASACPKPKEDEIWICADTVVHLENEILNKPETVFEATAMLKRLSGNKHFVSTGVCVQGANFKRSFYNTTKVTFKKLSTQEINYYIEVYKPFDKAGSYGIQEWLGMIGIEKIKGCYYNVMGLPLNSLYTCLSEVPLN